MHDVVTSFIMHEGRVLIVQRSAIMLSFPLKWGAISGSVERGESLLDAAYREVFEETGITRSSLSFVARIPPFDIAEGNKAWRVHSFMFVSSTNSVVINEENNTYRWIIPKNMATYDVVPGLVRAFYDLLNSK